MEASRAVLDPADDKGARGLQTVTGLRNAFILRIIGWNIPDRPDRLCARCAITRSTHSAARSFGHRKSWHRRDALRRLACFTMVSPADGMAFEWSARKTSDSYGCPSVALRIKASAVPRHTWLG